MADLPQAQVPNKTSPSEGANTLMPSGDRFITYSQTSGEISFHDGDNHFIIGLGWAGRGIGKNKPEYQGVKETGPLPRGWYRVGKPQIHPTVGPFALRLSPLDGTDMLGRDGFLIHGASSRNFGEESKGCIVAARAVREKIYSLGVQRLLVML